MKILFLDDDLNRHDEMKRRVRELENAGVGIRLHHATTVEGAKNTVPPFDAVFLDFDLAGKQMLPWGHEDSSTALIQWIGASPERLASSKKWILHSLNHTIYEKAKECIPGLIVAPGAWTRERFHSIIGTRLFGTEPMFPATPNHAAGGE